MPDDVLIAGAGPAGSVAALILARAGVRVRVLDRSTFPRPKLCGDTLNPGAVAILRRLQAADGVDRIAWPVRGMTVTGPRGVHVTGAYPAPVRGLSVSRRDLDWQLLQQAIHAGASFEPATHIRGAVFDAGGRVAGVRLTTAQGRSCELRAPVIIAADGRRSVLAFGLGLARHPPRPRRWAIGAYFDGGVADPSFGEMHVRGDRYIGVAAVPPGLTNACLVVAEPRRGALAQPAHLLTRALLDDPVLGGRFEGARMITAPVVMGPLAVDTQRPGAHGLLLAGDAAGFVDPITGDGLRFALRGAELAAAVALSMVCGHVRDPVDALLRARRRAFAGKWRLNRAIRVLVASPCAVSCAATSARLWPMAIRRLILAAGDVPRDGQRLARHR
jgi:flavin-dependent dehydrogenase